MTFGDPNQNLRACVVLITAVLGFAFEIIGAKIVLDGHF